MPRPAATNATARLEASDWVRRALEILAEQGVDAVRVEPLAKVLGVTKGSFYWHFADRDALLAALLEHWRQHATLDIIDRLEQTPGAPATRLSELLKLPFQGERSHRGDQVELAVRLWGRRDPRARAVLQEIDRLRLRYLERLFMDMGFQKTAAAARAVHAYCFMRVGGTLVDHSDENAIRACVQALLKS